MLSSERLTAAQAAKHVRARYLFGYLAEMKAQTIVVESEYTDGAYLDDYAHFYVKSFADYPRRCRRLHFFTSSFSDEEFHSWAVADGTVAELQEHYLGFVVVRPLPQAIIGRTALATYPDDGGRRWYPVTSTYDAHVFGTTLRVQSLAFQEQDTVLAACATVALWSAFQQCAGLFGTIKPSPAEITSMAATAEVRARALPSRGLTLGQVCRAIKAVGLEPEVFKCTSSTPLSSLLYAYVSAGLPAVLVVDIDGQGHAITLAGYSLREDRRLPREDMVPASPPVRRIGLRIDEWYGHDDQIGPFAHIFSQEHANENDASLPVIAFNGTWKTEHGGFRMLVPQHVIVPLYHKIRVTFLDVQEWIIGFNRLAERMIQNFEEFEWDTHLTTINKLKEVMRRNTRSPARDRILLTPGPRFLWRAILQARSRPAAELLFDATDMARSFPFLDVVFYDDEFRSNLREIIHAEELQDVLADLLTPQFRDFIRRSTE